MPIRTKRRSAEASKGSFRAKRAEHAREEILRAGLKVFARQGFRAATMEDIAAELAASKGLLYYYFRTKEEILNAILSNNALVAGIENGFEALRSMALREALQSMVRISLERMESHRELVRFLQVQVLLSTTRAQVVYAQTLERLQAAATEVIVHFQRSGEIRADVHVGDFARMIVDFITTYFAKKEMFASHHDNPEAYLDHLIDTLLNGVCARNQRTDRRRGKR
jgi:AcrR family transcriptional regulator